MTFPASKSRGFLTGFAHELIFIGGIGETTTVTQITSRSTGVELNTNIGQITTDTTSLAAGEEATFTVTNSRCTALSVPIVAIASGAVATTIATVTAVADGSFDITISNLHSATAETGAIVINFILIGGY